jgi:CMP-N,N'-diacetyllegionaminic acid synthase
MSIIAFIPARGGSKGVPKKNIQILLGKPLIAWSIEQALSSKFIDRVIVSTDCPKIAEVAIDYGAEVPYMRPDSLSNDTATTESAMLHCCEYLSERDELPELFMLVQCTSPIRSKEIFDLAITHFKSENLDSMLSVNKYHHFTWRDTSSPKASYDYKNRPRRQDINPENQDYLETGSFYITKTDALIESKNRLTGKIGMFITPENEGYEIDTDIDFMICEELMKNINN